MPLLLIPHEYEVNKGTLDERIDLLLEFAEKFKAHITQMGAEENASEKRPVAPADIEVAYNWDAIASILREIRVLAESSKSDKQKKGQLLIKLARVYEVLRGASMPRLESVRSALTNEAGQLGVREKT